MCEGKKGSKSRKKLRDCGEPIGKTKAHVVRSCVQYAAGTVCRLAFLNSIRNRKRNRHEIDTKGMEW